MHTEQDKIVYLILFLVGDVILCSEVSTTLMSWKLLSILMAGWFSVSSPWLIPATFCQR